MTSPTVTAAPSKTARTSLRHDPGVAWLLATGDASVRYLTLTGVVGISPSSAEARRERDAIPRTARVRMLLSARTRGLPPAPGVGGLQGEIARHKGGFGVHPYRKWDGAHWRLVSLVELGIPTGHHRAVAAAGQVLDWLTGTPHRRAIKAIDGRTRRCASQEGNALAVCSRLGLASDERVALLARSLVGWQWPDGGWNCDKNPAAHHSSFYESLAPLWGLIEYHDATGDADARAVAERASELFLRHRLFRSCTRGEVIDPDWTRLHYPLYWRYDILQALLVLSRLGPLDDPRLDEALTLVEEKRRPDGTWSPEGSYWRRPGTTGSNIEVVDWGRRGANHMLTLNALRVLKSGGRV